ncbi:recombinase family protein [Agarilytica rhodophyticola]|uniref:recombinase family protein n=1 Tax=Agarilytica rhodophyticola TaxID=1737490 RepID=UPI000B3422F0|nr:recombinase family protein [Agarilytica rhodophyticola]
MALIGYARVSTKEQNLDLQLHALKKAGCDIIYKDFGVSATALHRPQFERVLDILKADDVLVMWKMDRAFRSVKHALDILELFDMRGIKMRSLTEHIETSSAIGRCLYILSNSFAQLEIDLNAERTTDGMTIAKEKGVHVGRPRKLLPAMSSFIRYVLAWQPDITHRQIAAHFGISTRTLSRELNAQADPVLEYAQ